MDKLKVFQLDTDQELEEYLLYLADLTDQNQCFQVIAKGEKRVVDTFSMQEKQIICPGTRGRLDDNV